MSKTYIKNSSLVTNTAMEWLDIANWLTFSKIFFLIGAIAFTITTITGAKGGMIASYSYMTIGVFVTMFMASIMASMNLVKHADFLDIITTIGPLIIPGCFLLIPLSVLIYIFYTSGSTIGNNAEHLPPIFYKINIAAFISILIQAFILTKFYANEIESFTTNKTHSKKWLYISGLILTSIITGAISIELYVIITSFLTDG